MTGSAKRLFQLFLEAMVILLVCVYPACAQTASQQTTVAEQSPNRRSGVLPAPRGFQQFAQSGKLQLSLGDAIQLALENNTDIQVNESQIDTARASIGAARAPFDSTINGIFSTQRSTESSFSEAAIAPTLSGLSQQFDLGFSQTFETGTNVQTSVNATKFSSNINFGFVNPSVFGNFSIQISQPLLRGFGLLPNRGPIIVAQRNLAQSRATFRQQVATIVLNVATQYWSVVQARENLDVTQSLLAQAQQSYDHDKQALEKGALPPLDIYRSESQVAQRRVAHNGLKPQLLLSALYSGGGLNTTTTGPFLEALDQSFGFTQPTYGGSLTLNLPIRNYAAKAAFATAQISKRRDLYSERQLNQQITLDVANAVHQLEQSKLSMEAAKIALNLAQKNMQAEQRKYELGAETLFVVLETQSELAQVEQSLIQAQVGYQLAVAAVYHATGELLGNYNVTIAGS